MGQGSTRSEFAELDRAWLAPPQGMLGYGIVERPESDGQPNPKNLAFDKVVYVAAGSGLGFSSLPKGRRACEPAAAVLSNREANQSVRKYESEAKFRANFSLGLEDRTAFVVAGLFQQRPADAIEEAGLYRDIARLSDKGH